MSELRKCYICGEKVDIERDSIWYRIKCSNCALDFGRYWFTDKHVLVNTWNNWISKEAAKRWQTT